MPPRTFTHTTSLRFFSRAFKGRTRQKTRVAPRRSCMVLWTFLRVFSACNKRAWSSPKPAARAMRMASMRVSLAVSKPSASLGWTSTPSEIPCCSCDSASCSASACFNAFSPRSTTSAFPSTPACDAASSALRRRSTSNVPVEASLNSVQAACFRSSSCSTRCASSTWGPRRKPTAAAAFSAVASFCSHLLLVASSKAAETSRRRSSISNAASVLLSSSGVSSVSSVKACIALRKRVAISSVPTSPSVSNAASSSDVPPSTAATRSRSVARSVSATSTASGFTRTVLALSMALFRPSIRASLFATSSSAAAR
mmetsp:Transcript_24978/g.69623  ORF Transcript_24978/g.69623 Transcript_24978/m.69623 type:complete len:312 (+) Transcript_24978:1241-2176(+)